MQFRMRWGGLRAKIIAWFLVPTALILSVVAIFIFYTYQQVAEELVFERNQEVAQLLASQLAVDLAEYTDGLRVLAATAEVYEIRPDPLTQQVIIRFSIERLWDFDGGVMIVGPEGTVMAADQRRLDAVGQDWSERDYFRRAQATDVSLIAPVFSSIIPDGPEGSDVVALAVPAFGARGDFAGMTVGLFRLSPGSEARTSPFSVGIFRRLREVGGTNTYLVDESGRAIYHSDTWRIGEDLSTLVPVERACQGQVGSIRTTDLDGREIVASFAPVPGTPWGLVIEESWSALIGASTPYARLLLVLLALVIAIPALVVAVGSGRITRPLTDMTVAAQEMADGQLDQAIDVQTGDELEALARQFNRMSAQLQTSYATLEQRVADRTRELSTLLHVSRTVASTLELEPLLGLILDQLRLVVDYSGVALMTLEGGVLRPVAHRGPIPQAEVLAMRFPLDEARVHQAVVVGRAPLIIPDVRGDTPMAQAFRDFAGEYMETTFGAVRCWMGVPLVARDEVIGMVSFDHGEPHRYTERDAELAQAFASQTAIAIQNAQLYEQAQELAASKERQRLARDLHDAVSQTLFSTSLIAEVIPRLWERDPEEARRRLEELRQLTRGALAEMRTLLLELRPSALVETPLRDLLQQLCEATTSRARVEAALEVEDAGSLPVDVKVAFYRIAQEALNNVVKHAGAGRVTVRFRCVAEGEESRYAAMCVCDDGRGFDLAAIPPDHLGVRIMRERAQSVGAMLTVESEPGEGTEISVVWRGGSNA